MSAATTSASFQPALSVARRRWDARELDNLKRALEQTSLFYWNGELTTELVEKFRGYYPLKHIVPCSSGSAALHVAVAAAGLKPGDEVIVPPITDMGTVIGVLYQQGVPVFADVEADTLNLDPADVERRITPRTKAIIVVHLMGNPCEMAAFRDLADRHGLVLIEDCAQAWGSLYQGSPVGTLGDISCFSFNDFKHIGCGDGGIVAANNEEIGARLQVFSDKGYDRTSGVRWPEVLAPNYRITELQSAVACGQLDRLAKVVRTHHHAGTELSRHFCGIPGLAPQKVRSGNFATYWYLLTRFDKAQFRCTRDEFVDLLRQEGIVAGAGYLPGAMYQFPVFQNHSFFGGQWPVRDMELTTMDYRKTSCPIAERVLDEMIGLRLHESVDSAWIEATKQAFSRAADRAR